MKTLGAALFFAMLALALTAPVWQAPSDRIAGNIEHPGIRGELFHQWDFCHQAREGKLATYYRTDRVAWPEGQDLRRFIGFSLHLFFYLPFRGLNDLVLSYNLLVVLTLWLNGFSAFLLFRRVSGAYWPALAAGILFAMSPYALLKLEQGFLQKAILWWLPLFLLFLLRYFDGRRRGDATGTGLCWLAALLTYAPYAWFATLAGLILLACRAMSERFGMGWGHDHTPTEKRLPADTGLLRGLWPMAVLAAAGVVFLMWLLPDAGRYPPEGLLPVAVADAPIGSLDIFHAFRFFPYAGFRAAVERLPLGLSLTAVLFALIALLRRAPGAGSFLALALVFGILTLGPFLSCHGEIVSRLPLPYYAISLWAPWGSRLGYSIRAMPFLELAILSLAALAVSGWRPSPRAPLISLFLSVTMLTLGVAEKVWLLSELFPLPVTDAKIPPDIAWMRRHARVVLHLPYNVRGEEPHEYCYFSARSNTRMMNPYLDLRAEGFPLPPLPDPDPALMADYLTGLARAGVTHIAIHPQVLRLPPPRGIVTLPAATCSSKTMTERIQRCSATGAARRSLTILPVC